MAGYNNSNQFKELDKNTKGTTLRNTKSEFKSALEIAYWNSALKLIIHPPLPESERSNERVIDYKSDAKAHGILGIENALLLLEAIKVEVVPNLAEFEYVGISAGQSYIEIARESGVKGANERGLYLNIYTQIDGSGNPKHVLSYQFAGKKYFKNFKREGYEMSNTFTQLPTEFMLFITHLEEAVKAMTNAVAHSIRNANKYEYARNVNMLNKMAEKMNITQADMYSKGNSNNSNGGSYFNGGSQNSAPSNDTFDYKTEYENAAGGDRMDLD